MRSAQNHRGRPADQRVRVAALLHRLVHLFQQMLHVVTRMQCAVADEAHVRIDKLQL